MTARAICFDLDGTLVNSLPDIIASQREAIAEHGLPVPPPGRVRPLIGLPLEETFARLAPAGDPAALSASYRRIYPARFTRGSAPFAEVPEVLATLRQRGWLLAVTTTKGGGMARDLVAALDLAKHLDHVQGTDGFPAKPAPDVIHRALETLGAEGVWMVGDTTHDIEAGRGAGLATYAVCRPEATHPRDVLAAAAPDRLEESLTGLLALAPAQTS